MAILLVEQFYDFAAGLADHYLVMSRGAIVQQGKGGELDPLGGFIKDQQLWAAGQRAANRQLLLLAAG